MLQVIPGGAVAKPVRHASQRARRRHVPAHRARAVPEAARRRRLRARLRDQPQFPQRGPVDAAQPRVHDARAVPGVCRLPRLHGHGRAHVPGPGATRARHAPGRIPGRGLRLRPGVPARHGRGPGRAFQPRHRRATPARRRVPARRLRAARHRTGQPRTAPASCRSRSSRRPPSTACCSRPSCMRIRPKCRRSRGATTPIRSSRIASSSSSADARSPMASPSSTMPRPGGAVSRAGRAQDGGRRGGDVLRRRLRPRAGIRHAADGGPRHRRRSHGHAVHRTSHRFATCCCSRT